MGERRALTTIIMGALVLALFSGAVVWAVANWSPTGAADTIVLERANAPAGEYVAHASGTSALQASVADGGQWQLDGETCVARFAVAREQDNNAPALTLPVTGGGYYPYLASSSGAVSVEVPKGTSILGWADFISTTRKNDWPGTALDTQQDLRLFRQTYPSAPVEHGRALLRMDEQTRVALPWEDAVAGQRRQVNLTIRIGPTDRCDRLKARWERNYSMDVQTVEAVHSRGEPTLATVAQVVAGTDTKRYVNPRGAREVYGWLIAEVESLYAGFTTAASYATTADWVSGLPITSNSDSGVPTAGQIITRSTSYGDKPTGTTGFGMDFNSGDSRYYLTHDAGYTNQKLYRRDSANWTEIPLFAGARTDAVFARHFADAAGEEIKIGVEGTGAGSGINHAFSIPNVNDAAVLFKRSDADVAAMFPDRSGDADVITYAWNRRETLRVHGAPANDQCVVWSDSNNRAQWATCP